ncbi:3'-5' exonuclease [Pontibacter sp. SGAir0037]|uniref:3'-5' exonuclease n=1 Tax=Pontibacter sp. SGAir0037 TaxID=2571030 RepID=UPI00143CD099|nr:3'-5' exonuclease [Pontibacter sp. SGAir0037]
MREHILFVDTETSGIPKDWHAPYATKDNWPFIVQIAWVIYTRDGQLIKTGNYYIKANDYTISDTSKSIHGITEDYLQAHGEERKTVMQWLHNDLLTYQPLVVSHFAQLDFHMLGLGFYRSGLSNPVTELPTFCTMTLTQNFILRPHQRLLRLGELYQRLFNMPLDNQHDALADAEATAKCFFKLLERGDISERIIDRQQKKERLSYELGRKNSRLPYLLLTLALGLLLILILLFNSR